MTVDPIPELINRDLNPEFEAAMRQFSAPIEDAVNFGSHVLVWLRAKLTVGYPDYPILFSLRHILELLDSLSILVSRSSIEPCKPLLRAMLETYMGLRYMLEEDNEGERNKRVMAYMVCYIHNMIKSYQRLDTSTDEGKRLRGVLKLDRVVGENKFPEMSDSKGRVQELTELLEEQQFREAEQEYKRIREERREARKKKRAARGKPQEQLDPDIIPEQEADTRSGLEWYSMFGGPQDIERLALHLGLTGMYEGRYRSWSDALHGTDIFTGRLHQIDEHSFAILQLRVPVGVERITTSAFEIALGTYKIVIGRFVTEMESQLLTWYYIHKPFIVKISGEPLIRLNITDIDEPSS